MTKGAEREPSKQLVPSWAFAMALLATIPTVLDSTFGFVERMQAMIGVGPPKAVAVPDYTPQLDRIERELAEGMPKENYRLLSDLWHGYAPRDARGISQWESLRDEIEEHARQVCDEIRKGRPSSADDVLPIPPVLPPVADALR